MTDDIVTILRNECQCSDDCRGVNDPCISMRAADEIERLRADLENVRDMNEQLTEELQTYYSEDELNADWE